jgi:hypothetical protein
VIQRREEFLDVGLQHVAKTAGKLLAAVHGGVRAFALATGVGIRNERPLVNRLQHVDEGMVDDPIPVRGRTDLPFLGFVDEEAAVGSWSVGVGGQFLVQRPQRPFLIEVKCGHGRAESLALARLLGGTEQALEGDEPGPEIADPLHGLPLLLSQPPTSLPISSIAFAAKP